MVPQSPPNGPSQSTSILTPESSLPVGLAVRGLLGGNRDDQRFSASQLPCKASKQRELEGEALKP